MTYRLADSLDELRNEVNARWPTRSKVSDGWLGDASHRATASDHNPNAAGVVCALDLTNDPDSGADMTLVSELLRTRPHPDVKYVIRHWSREMFSAYPAHGVEPFTWREYTGAAATELHVSVGVGRDGQSVEPYDDRDSWFALFPPPAPVPPAPVPTIPQEDDMPTLTPRCVVLHPQDPTSGYELDARGGIHPFGHALPVRSDRPAPPYFDNGAALQLVIVDWSVPSGLVLDAKGALHAFGGAVVPDGVPYWEHAFVPPAP